MHTRARTQDTAAALHLFQQSLLETAARPRRCLPHKPITITITIMITIMITITITIIIIIITIIIIINTTTIINITTTTTTAPAQLASAHTATPPKSPTAPPQSPSRATCNESAPNAAQPPACH